MCARGTQCARLEHKRVHKDHIHAFFGVSARSIVRESVRMRESRRGISKAFVLLALCSRCFFHSYFKKHHRPLVKSSRNTTPD